MRSWKRWLAAAAAACIMAAGCSSANRIGDPARQNPDPGAEAAGSLYEEEEGPQLAGPGEDSPPGGNEAQAGGIGGVQAGGAGPQGSGAGYLYESGALSGAGAAVDGSLGGFANIPAAGAAAGNGGGDVSGCDLVIASDIHYLSSGLTDFNSGFTYMVEHGDGKVVNYIWQITDAFLEEVKRWRPDALILCGDLTLNGELRSHQELAAKLAKLEQAGIPVYVMPGNHDIQNTGAAAYREEVRFPAEYTAPGQFTEIYGRFGYDEAISRDPSSLSYVCQLDDYNRLMMLDTCQYDPVNQVGGMLEPDTYDWIEEQLEAAWDQGMNVIPAAHHNLLDQSEIYVKDCTIEHSEELIGLLEDWDVPLFLSGHLHVQHFMRSDDEEGGIWEIVTSSLATPPCQYGMLHYGDDGSFRYETRQVDMEGWAKRHGEESEDLLHFTEYGREFLGKVFYNQAQDEFKRFDEARQLTSAQKEEMAAFYAKLNTAYYAGTAVNDRNRAFTQDGYRLWEEWISPSILTQYLEYIISSSDRDYNRLQCD